MAWSEPYNGILDQAVWHFRALSGAPPERDSQTEARPPLAGAVLVVWVVAFQRLQHPVCVVRAPGVEIHRRRGPLVSHHALHHVRRDAVIDEPGGIGVPQVVEAQSLCLILGDELYGGRLSGCSLRV